jgi:hypothetical protein
MFASFYPAEVAGAVLVDGVHPDLLNKKRPGARRSAHLPEFVYRSQDAVAQLCNQAGIYRIGLPDRPAPAPPNGLTHAEWTTIWHLTQSSTARSTLIQEIASWERSASEVRAAGTLGDRPLVVIYSESVPFPELQTDLLRLSSRARLMTYQARETITDAVRQVVAEVR